MWRCARCPCVIRTRCDDTIIDPNVDHNYEKVTLLELEKLRMKEQLRTQALRLPDEKPSHIIADSLQENDFRFKNNHIENFRRFIRSTRNKVFKKLPKHRKKHFQS